MREEKQKARREANKSRTEGDSALTQAKKRAQEILDLSASDIDNLLNSEDDDSDFESDDKVLLSALICTQLLLLLKT